MPAVIQITDNTELTNAKQFLKGAIGISASKPATPSTSTAAFETLWNRQTAGDVKFKSIDDVGGQLQASDFSMPPVELEAYYAYVSPEPTMHM